MGESSLHLMFATILRWHYSVKNEFSKDVILLLNPVIEATLDVFNEAKKKLLPTPTKSHYTFNLRDYARVIQVGFQELVSKALALALFVLNKLINPNPIVVAIFTYLDPHYFSLSCLSSCVFNVITMDLSCGENIT